MTPPSPADALAPPWPHDARLLGVTERGGRTELDFELGEAAFVCWIDPREPDGRAFRRVDGARLGYRGDLTPQSTALVEAVAARLKATPGLLEALWEGSSSKARVPKSTPPKGPVGRALRPEEVATFAEAGWLRVEGFFPRDLVERARKACDRRVYGRSFEEQLAAFDAGDLEGSPFLDGGDIGHAPLPFGDPSLDALGVDDALLQALGDLVGGPPRFCEGGVYVRFSPTDARHGSEPWQGWHADHDTNCWLPPAEPIEDHHYVIAGVVLTDVGPEQAPTALAPGSHRLLARDLSRWIQDGLWQGTRELRDLREVPGIGPTTTATARAGDVLFWSSCMLHSAIPFADRRCQRAVLGVTAVHGDRAAACDTPSLLRPPHRANAHAFLTAASPAARTFFGWPPPGDAAWTDEACDRLESWLPGIDAGPYRAL